MDAGKAPVLIRHDAGCKYARPEGGGHTDAAKRIRDTVNLHMVANRDNSRGCFIACALADGSSDGVLYPTRRAAVIHQHHDEQWYLYIRIMGHSMTICQAESLLYMHRLAYDNGFRMADPDGPGGGHDLIPRITREENAALITALERGQFPVQRT